MLDTQVLFKGEFSQKHNLFRTDGIFCNWNYMFRPLLAIFRYSGLLRHITGKQLSTFRRTCVLSILWVCQSKKKGQTPNMDSVGPSQTSVTTRHLARQNTAEDLRLHLSCYENFKPRTWTVVFHTIILNIPQNYSYRYQDICIELSLHDSVKQYNW